MKTEQTLTVDPTPNAIFAVEHKVKRETWTLGELMDAAGVPADAEITVYVQGYDGMERMHRSMVVCEKEERFDENGRRLKLVQKEKRVEVTQYYDEWEPC